MENLESIDAGKYTYIPRDIEFNFWVKLHDYIASIFSRKNVLKKFCLDCNIDYPVQGGKHYHLPTNYLVEADEISYLGKLRDRIILSQREKYIVYQRDVLKEMDRLEKELALERKYLADEKRRLEQLKNKLRNVKDDALEQISLESNVASQEAKVKNQETNVNHLSEDLQLCKSILISNLKAWKQQIDIIKDMVSTQTSKFITSATKRIRDKLNFTVFRYKVPPYNESVQKIIKGEYNEGN